LLRKIALALLPPFLYLFSAAAAIFLYSLASEWVTVPRSRSSTNGAWEFDTEKFSEIEPTANKHWAFPERIEQRQADLLYSIPEAQ
jgi:hypothetical protein